MPRVLRLRAGDTQQVARDRLELLNQFIGCLGTTILRMSSGHANPKTWGWMRWQQFPAGSGHESFQSFAGPLGVTSCEGPLAEKLRTRRGREQAPSRKSRGQDQGPAEGPPHPVHAFPRTVPGDREIDPGRKAQRQVGRQRQPRRVHGLGRDDLSTPDTSNPRSMPSNSKPNFARVLPCQSPASHAIAWFSTWVAEFSGSTHSAHLSPVRSILFRQTLLW
jgi:hypothetical protein